MDTLECALHYAEVGLLTFPIHGILDGTCTCGRLRCPHPGKHPRTKRGVRDATGRSDQIRNWIWQSSNIGIACGNDLVVLDIDPRSGGMESLGRLQERYGPEPFITVTSQT